MFLIDLLFPQACVVCGALGRYLCTSCRKKLLYVHVDSCFYCRKPSLYGFTHYCCKQKNGVDGWMSLLFYNSIAKRIIAAIKYRFVVGVLSELFLSLEPQSFIKLKILNITSPTIYVQPVPLHSSKKRLRGLNQAELLSDFFLRFISGLKSNAVIRVRATSPQAKLQTNRERHRNIKDAFLVDTRSFNVVNKNFIIVDDVVTSGFTIKEITKALKKEGALKVFVLSLARS